MSWWPFLRSSARPSPDGAPAAADLEAAVVALRQMLRAERHRLRPDSWALAWEMVEHAAEYAPAWTRLQRTRPVETQELVLALTDRLDPLLRDFLALPDSDKPAHADAVHARLLQQSTEHARLCRRLTRALTARLRGGEEL
ncbi:hypothetical protein [Micrococcus luteus]|uniref:hypothetical protein n=1 Tax=Micrococcus luteus TaxID=1270 RepID=UPI0036CC5D61